MNGRAINVMLSLLLVAILHGSASAQKPYYAGKTITIVAGTKAGDAAKKKLEIDPSSSDELIQLSKEVTSQSPDIIAKMNGLLGK